MTGKEVVVGEPPFLACSIIAMGLRSGSLQVFIVGVLKMRRACGGSWRRVRRSGVANG